MSQEAQRDQIAQQRVIYTVPGMDAVTVRRDEDYRLTEAGPLTLDLYYPPDTQRPARLPAVIVVLGYPDQGFQKRLGCRFKEMGSSISWARLLAASGLVAITYTNREPVVDLRALLEYLRSNAASLGIDETRLALWANSGHVPLALSVLMERGVSLQCAVLCYGYMLDLDGFTGVAEAARRFGFVNPGAGKSVDDLPREIPLFIARAGLDQCPQLNATLDRFLARALACNLPITLLNHPQAPHAFDLFHDCETSREIIRQSLAFLRCHLSA